MLSRACVYEIRNRLNNKRYIGSTIHPNTRNRDHFYLLENDKHHSDHLQNSYNKYGERCFKYTVLMYCERERIQEMEQHFIDYYESYDADNGYNMNKKANWNEIPEEVRQKHKENNEGENNNNSKLDEITVREVRKRLKYSTKTLYEIADEFDMSMPMIKNIKNGDHWKNVEFEGEVEIERVNYDNEFEGKLTENEVKVIMRKLLANDKTQLEIANEHNINESIVCRINSRDYWSHVSIPEVPDGEKISTVRTKYSEKTIRNVKKDMVKGFSTNKLTEKYGISENTLCSIRRGNLWSDLEVEGFEPKRGKLTREEVREIKKELRDTDRTYNDIAEEYNKTRASIGQINRGQTWTDVKVEGFEAGSDRTTGPKKDDTND